MVKKIETNEVGHIHHNILYKGVFHPNGKIWEQQVKQFCKEHKGKCAKFKITIELVEQ